MKTRLKQMTRYQKVLCIILAAMIPLFAAVYAVAANQPGVVYRDSLLIHESVGEDALYTGYVDWKKVQFEVDADTITLDTDIVEDLGADSLDLVDMLMTLEDEFSIGEVPDEMLEKIRTVGQLVTYIEENI